MRTEKADDELVRRQALRLSKTADFRKLRPSQLSPNRHRAIHMVARRSGIRMQLCAGCKWVRDDLANSELRLPPRLQRAFQRAFESPARSTLRKLPVAFIYPQVSDV